MKVLSNLGICIDGEKIYYAELSGSTLEPVLEKLTSDSIKKTNNIGELMSWFQVEFKAKLDTCNYDKVSYCLVECKKTQRYSMCIYPYAILNKICHEKNIPVIQKTTPNFNNKKIGGKKITEECIVKFKLPKTCKAKQRAVMAAWCEL